MAKATQSTTETTSKETPNLRKGKKQKVFVERKDAALALATSIAEAQEEKSKDKAARHHQHELAQKTSGASGRKHGSVSSKDRLKQAKAAILAEKSQAKKEKAKQKQAKLRTKPGEGVSSSIEKGIAKLQERSRKSVSFV
ncbi:unnamed protein product [Somion occarium]|uniref:Uncharacterized protein n=1 Tax=Somion occarium TaxID=3059160 RepID=A0ABP1D7K0_9APHY